VDLKVGQVVQLFLVQAHQADLVAQEDPAALVVPVDLEDQVSAPNKGRAHKLIAIFLWQVDQAAQTRTSLAHLEDQVALEAQAAQADQEDQEDQVSSVNYEHLCFL
jgi:hypothetical protein